MKWRMAVSLIGIFMVAVGSVGAQDIFLNVLNHSFEDAPPTLTKGNGNTGIPDWDTLSANSGFYYPTLRQYSGTNIPSDFMKDALGIPDGKQVAYIRGGLGFTTQNTGVKIEFGATYTLSVDVGSAFDSHINHYIIGLANRGVDPSQGSAPTFSDFFAAVTNDTMLLPRPHFRMTSTPKDGFFTNSMNMPVQLQPVAVFTGDNSNKGGFLSIVLQADGPGEASFDNVTLKKVPRFIDPMNEYLPPPTAPSGSFKMVLMGDVRNNINLDKLARDENVNPFAFVERHFGFNQGLSTVTASLDGNGNTVVIFSGPRAILPTDKFIYSNDIPYTGNLLPHFGFEGADQTADGTLLRFISQTWVPGNGQPTLPVITLFWPDDPNCKLLGWSVIFADVTANGQTVGQWFEAPITECDPQLFFVNDTGMSETLSHLGFFLSSTQIPLDQLNWPSLPPPGQPGSPFTRLNWLDGQTLQSGSRLSFVVPEPSPFLFGAIGFVMLAGFAGLRRLRSHRKV